MIKRFIKSSQKHSRLCFINSSIFIWLYLEVLWLQLWHMYICWFISIAMLDFPFPLNIYLSLSGCSCGYCLDLYPHLATLNSQVNEQGNAGLKRIKDQLSYMTAENFMKHCSFYLWDKNTKVIVKWDNIVGNYLNIVQLLCFFLHVIFDWLLY